MMAKRGKPTRGRRKQFADVSLAGSRQLDRNSNVPLYFQLGGVLKEKVDAGAWQPGDRFPTEREIAEEFDVSRTVIRRALDLLVGDGGIIRVKGSGAFVASPRRQVAVVGVVQALLEPTPERTLTIFSAREEPPDHTVAHFLDMEKQATPVVQVTAVMHMEEKPLCLVQSYSSTNLVPWLLPVAEALQTGGQVSKPGQLELGPATVSIEVTFFGSWGGPKVGASAGDPALMARLVQFGTAMGMKRARPLEFAYLICPSDSAQFVIELD